MVFIGILVLGIADNCKYWNNIQSLYSSKWLHRKNKEWRQNCFKFSVYINLLIKMKICNWKFQFSSSFSSCISNIPYTYCSFEWLFIIRVIKYTSKHTFKTLSIPCGGYKQFKHRPKTCCRVLVRWADFHIIENVSCIYIHLCLNVYNPRTEWYVFF